MPTNRARRGGQKLPTLSRVKDTESDRGAAKRLSGESGITVTHRDIGRLRRGLEPRNPRKRHALGLPETVAVAVCPDCGQPPLSKRHKCGDKFERNAAEYDRWKAAQMPHILDILNWAETR